MVEAAEDPDSANISMVLYDMARIERDLGRVTDADRDFRRCLTLREKVFGPTSREVAITLDGYALLLRGSGRDADAAAIEARARAIPRREPLGGNVMFSPTH